jgi:hypothetical protein
MPRFQVQISEPPPIVDSRVSPGGIGSFVRGGAWEGEASDEAAAIAAAWVAWDEKYGPHRQPADAIIRVSDLDG